MPKRLLAAALVAAGLATLPTAPALAWRHHGCCGPRFFPFAVGAAVVGTAAAIATAPFAAVAPPYASGPPPGYYGPPPGYSYYPPPEYGPAPNYAPSN